ncbi:MAG: ral nucleoside transport system ATP-binding protein [Actinomycetota bacterium]|jgi:simple sugar transport system ATP-binding protein|nr:ral nucleoside transport system ATP-binding protein [Actinomycetota bacterium]
MSSTPGSDEAGRSGAPLIVLQGIRKVFPGVVANDDVDLELQTGEIHALIGENGAGKSTLMRVLYGMYSADDGTISVKGEQVKITSPRQALALGIGMVHQHFVLVDRFTVTENIILGSEGGAVLDLDKSEKKVDELAREYGFAINPKALVDTLSVGQEQRVEILKALYRGVDVLILDEPTAVLTPNETRELFVQLKNLKAAGKTIVFISHKLDEVLGIADRITVLRRGKVVGETTPAETTKQKLAEMMVGRPVLFRLDKPAIEMGEPILEIESISLDTTLNEVGLAVHGGEILGVAGVEGNGQLELAEVVMGLHKPDSGSVSVGGKDVTSLSCAERREAGVAYVPEDRHGRGLVLDMTLWENTALGRQTRPQYSTRFGVLLIRKIKELATRLIKEFDVRARSIAVQAATLSGGNQQKLILARELEDDPLLLIAHQPTRGLDVGAIEFVWKQILDQKAAGRAVLLISAELDEIYALSDRIVTIYEGQLTGEFTPDATPEQLGLAMTGKKAKAS